MFLSGAKSRLNPSKGEETGFFLTNELIDYTLSVSLTSAETIK